MSFDNRVVGPEQSDSVRFLRPIHQADFIRDELEAVWAKAYCQWEFVWDLSEADPDMRENPVWCGLQHYLAVRADEAFDELENYKAGQA